MKALQSARVKDVLANPVARQKLRDFLANRQSASATDTPNGSHLIELPTEKGKVVYKVSVVPKA